MLVFGDGSSTGSVGGGELESRVREEALVALTDRQPRLMSYSLLNPGTGDPGVCGGTVEIYVEPFMPKSTVYVIGCGHVGKAVTELATWLDYRVVVWDDRNELIDELDDSVIAMSGDIEVALGEIPIDEHTRVVMVTRNVGLDAEILPHVLASPTPSVGLMGSKRRWSTTRDQLIKAGIDKALLAKVHTPIGVELGAETPAEIAVSIMAEVVAAERGSI